MSGLAGLQDGERYAHGTRARYVSAKCRCEPCRAANSAYRRQRVLAVAAGDARGLVPAATARAHLAALRKQGVGVRAVADASDVGISILRGLTTGRAKQLRASTERRILAVDAGAVADGGHVSARPTWRLIREMLRAGYTKRELALRLGAASPQLQISRRLVEARTALAVERIHREVMAEVAIRRERQDECAECGRSHAASARRSTLARMAGADMRAIEDALPCWYGGERGRDLLHADLSRIRRGLT